MPDLFIFMPGSVIFFDPNVTLRTFEGSVLIISSAIGTAVPVATGMVNHRCSMSTNAY